MVVRLSMKFFACEREKSPLIDTHIPDGLHEASWSF